MHRSLKLRRTIFADGAANLQEAADGGLAARPKLPQGRLMLTGLQIRTARNMLGWDLAWLAKKAGIRPKTLLRAESYDSEPDIHGTQDRKLRQALEAAASSSNNRTPP